MENFRFSMPTNIIFGRGAEEQLGAETARMARSVLLHYGGGSIKKSGLYDAVVASLREAGVDFVELGGVQPNPRLSLVQEGIRLCREHKLEGILAVGGGSVIDSAKAIGIGVPHSGDVWEFFTREKTPTRTLPVGVVLTIPAAGSEASKSTVITNEQGSLKLSVDIDLIKPVFAIMNPEHTFSLPPFQTACGVADIMAHIMERYFTNVQHVDLTDRLCEATLKTVIQNAPRALQNPTDYDSRAEIMWASTIAHNDLLSTGRVGDWASHRIEHEISALYDVAHGAGLAAVFPAWMKYTYSHDVRRFVQFAVRVWGLDQDFAEPERTAIAGIHRLEEFWSGIGLPVTLTQLKVPSERIQEMAARCAAQGSVGAFVPIRKPEAQSILQLAV